MKVSVILLLVTTSLTFGQKAGPECLDLDFHFALFNPPIKHNSKVKKITDLVNCYRDSVYIKVNFARNVLYDYNIKGIAIEVINTTEKDFEFNDNISPDILCEVKYNDKWLIIEKNKEAWGCLPRSFVIPPNSYVTAIVPCYKGTETVTMRYKFTTWDRAMYSDEFIGTINPGLLK